jgi:hypothetical protein
LSVAAYQTDLILSECFGKIENGFDAPTHPCGQFALLALQHQQQSKSPSASLLSGLPLPPCEAEWQRPSFVNCSAAWSKLENFPFDDDDEKEEDVVKLMKTKKQSLAAQLEPLGLSYLCKLLPCVEQELVPTTEP